MINKVYWTEEQVLSTVDAGTQKRGKSLAKAKDWTNKGVNDIYLWGECKGSTLYYVKIRMEPGAMKHACTCPVRGGAPCKHVIGLMLYWLGNEGDFNIGDLPDWVEEWRKKHDAKIEKAQEIALSPEAAALKEKSKAERRQKRLENMQHGIEELQLVLQDFIMQGVANSAVMNRQYWNKIAKRMVDAQMPRVANYLQETFFLIRATDNWLDILIERIGELNLLVQAFQYYKEALVHNASDESAFEGMEDLLTALGVSVMKKDVLNENQPIQGRFWLVTAVIEDTDVESRRFRKVWLKELPNKSNTFAEPLHSALILDYTFNNAGYEMQYDFGRVYSGDLTYYSSMVPQRAVLSNAKLELDYAGIALEDLQPFSNLTVLLDAYAVAISRNIWLNEYFAILDKVYYKQDEVTKRIYLEDEAGIQLNIAGIDQQTHYTLMSIVGTDSITLIGTLTNTCTFYPLTIYIDNSFIAIGSLVENYFKHSYEKLFVSSEI